VNLLDENIPLDQHDILEAHRLHCRAIGREISRFSVGDEDIIALLHRLKQPTFFTRDEHFFKRRLCHAGYCLVWLDVRPTEAADFVRRFLSHPRFNTKAKRMGIVARVHHDGIQAWKRDRDGLQAAGWSADAQL